MHNIFNICSEGGTGENRRIDPHLNVGILEKTIIIFGKNWFRSSPRLKIFSDPHLDKIRSALTEHYNDVIHIICIQFKKYFQICIFIAPNVSYYLPDYKPPNPEVPVVHGLPSATEKQYEVEEVPYEQKPKVSFILQNFF